MPRSDWHRDDQPRLVRVEAPQTPALSTAEAQDELRVDAFDEYGVIERKAAAAIGEIDGRDGWLGRALITQTWDLILPGFPTEGRIVTSHHLWMTYTRKGTKEITIPLPPLQEISSVKYTDAEGDEQELTDYRLIEGEPARILPAYGEDWPVTREDPDAVRIRFKAGYGDNPEDVPAVIREYLLATVVSSFEYRGQIVDGSINPLPHVRNMLESYRVRSAL